MLGNKSKILSIILTVSLVLSGCQFKTPSDVADASVTASETTKTTEVKSESVVAKASTANKADTSAADNTVSKDEVNVLFDLQSSWEGGYVGNITITNTGAADIKNWVLEFDYQGSFGSVWNVDYDISGSKYTFKPLDWNNTIEAGKSIDFGFTGAESFKSYPNNYKLAYDIVSADGGTSGVSTDITADNTGSSTGTSDSSSEAKSETDEDEDDGTSGVASSTSGGNQVSKHGRLKVKGRYIVDKNNKKYQLKGISTHGVAWFPQYVNKSAFNSFKKMGANTVRLACYSSSGEGYNTSSVWKTMDRGIKAASDLGMYVIVDWHILNNGNPKTDMKAAKKFFKRFAKKYGKKKNIIWEICNEPNGCNWSSDIKPYAKTMIKLIRKYSSNIIVVGTPTWSQDVDVVADSPLTGSYKKNVCYTLHFYAATHKDNIRNKVKYAYKKKLPILCTEFSICDASGNGGLDKSSAKTWIALLNKYKIGFVAWNLSNKAESSSFIKSSVTKTGNFKKSDLSASGKWIVKKW